MALRALCAASPNNSGSRAYVATSPHTYAIVRYVIVIITLTQISAPPSDACSPTNHMRRCTSTSSVVRARFRSAPVPSRFSLLSMGKQDGPRRSRLTTRAPKLSLASLFPSGSPATALQSKFNPIATPNSPLFEEFCTSFRVDKKRTTPYRLQSNGKCERFYRTLITMLRRAVQRRPYDWEPLLPAVL